jgi:hypothetical protein
MQKNSFISATPWGPGVGVGLGTGSTEGPPSPSPPGQAQAPEVGPESPDGHQLS